MQRIVWVSEVLRRLGISRRMLYVWEDAGKFPRRCRFDSRVGWPEDVVDEACRRIGAERTTKTIGGNK